MLIVVSDQFFFIFPDELEALEDLHMCHILKVSADLFEYTYSSLFLVSIPCKNFKPIVSKVNITRFGKRNTRYKDDFPKLSTFLLTAARELIAQGDDMTVREVRTPIEIITSCLELNVFRFTDRPPPERLLVFMCPTPLTTHTIGHQIPDGNRCSPNVA